MGELRFVVHQVTDYSVGAALGELTDARDKQFRQEFNGLGGGRFVINRHSAQFAWCETGNFVKVYITGSDDPIGAFWLEEGAVEAVSSEEEGGEDATLGGPGPLHYLRNAILYHTTYTDNDSGLPTLTRGTWQWTNVKLGGPLVRQLEEAQARGNGGAIPDVTWDFTRTLDSEGVAWTTDDFDFEAPVGMDLLTFVSELQKADLIVRMDHDLSLHAWEEFGEDRSDDVQFRHGVNIRDAAEKQIHATAGKTVSLTQGTKVNGNFIYKEVVKADFLGLGRREGFAGQIRTGTDTMLRRVGQRYINSTLLQFAGPTTAGIVEEPGDPVAFIDYVPGDSVLVDIPDVYDEEVVRVWAIILVETDAGEYDPIIEFEAVPFSPTTGPDSTSSSGGNTGGSGGGKTCGDCPPPPPYVPPGPGTPTLVQENCGVEAIGSDPLIFGLDSPATVGNLLVAFAIVRTHAGLPDTPAGWTANPDNPTGGDNLSGFYKVAAGGETTVAFNYEAVVGGVWYISEWSGVGELVDSNHIYNPTNTGSLSAGDIVLSSGGLVIGAIGVKDGSDVDMVTAATAGAGSTEGCEGYLPGPSHPFFWAGYRVESAAGTYAVTASISSSGNPDNHRGLSFGFAAGTSSSAPDVGDGTCEEITFNGTDTTYETNFGYPVGGGHLQVGGVSYVTTRPDATHFDTGIVFPAGVKGVFCYYISDPTGTGAGNPQPSDSTNTMVPPWMLGSGAIGDGLQALTDNGTWQGFRWNIKGGLEKYAVIEDAGAAAAMDLDLGNIFDVTLSEDADLSFDNVPAIDGRASDATMLLRLNGHTPTFAGATFVWATASGLPPDWPTDPDAVVLLGSITLDGGTTWVIGGPGVQSPITSTDGMVPYYIGPSEIFTVPEFKQALFAMPIDVAGTLAVDGYLIEVD